MRLLQKLLSLHGAIVTLTPGPTAAKGGHVLRRPAAAPPPCPPPVQYPVPPVPKAHSLEELQALAWSDADVEKYLVLPLREIDVYTSEAYTNPDSPYGWDTHERFVAKHSPSDASGSGRGIPPGAKHAPMSATSFRALFSDRFVPSLKAYFRSLHARARTSQRTRIKKGKTAASAVHPLFASTRWLEADDAALAGRTLVHPAVHKAVHCHALARLALDGRLQDILWLKNALDSVSTELVEDRATAAAADGAGAGEDEEQRKLHQDDLQHVPRITLDLTVDLLGLCFRGKRAEQVVMRRPAAARSKPSGRQGGGRGGWRGPELEDGGQAPIAAQTVAEQADAILRRIRAAQRRNRIQRGQGPMGPLGRGLRPEDADETDFENGEEDPQRTRALTFTNLALAPARPADRSWPWLRQALWHLNARFSKEKVASVRHGGEYNSKVQGVGTTIRSGERESGAGQSYTYPFRMRGRLFVRDPLTQRDWNVTDTDKTEYFLPVGVVITRHRSPLNLLLVNMVNEIDEAHQAAHRKTKNLDTVSGLPVGQPGSSAPRHTPRRGRGTESARPPADVYSHLELSVTVAVEEVGEVRDPLLALLEAVGLRFTGSAPAGAAREDDAAHSGADRVVEEQLARLQTALFAERFDDKWWGKPAKIFWPATLEERRGYMAQPNVVSLAAAAVPTFLHASDQLQLEEQWRRRSSAESAVTGNMTLSLVMIYGLDPRLASPTPLSFNVPASGMDGEEVPGQHTTVRKTRPYELMERLADGQRGLWITARTDSATPSPTRPQVEGNDSSQLQQLADHYLFKDSFCSQLIGKIAALRLVKLTETMEEFESAPDVEYLSDDVASGSGESRSKVGQVVRNGFREAGSAHDDARMVAAMTAFRHLETLALETVGVFRKQVVGATRGDVARTLELALDNVWIRSRRDLYSFIGAEDYGHSVDRSIKLDRPELLEKTIAAARKRFAELPSEHEATGTSTTENKNEMATSLRALSLKALFERGRKPKLAQMLMRQWLDELRSQSPATEANAEAIEQEEIRAYWHSYPLRRREEQGDDRQNQVLGLEWGDARDPGGLSATTDLLQYWATSHDREMNGMPGDGYVDERPRERSFRFSANSPTLVSLRRYQTFVFFVEKGKLPLWQPRVHSNDRDITIAGEMCRWIKEEGATEAGTGHHSPRKLISFLPAGEDIDTSAPPSDNGTQDDVRDLSFRHRSPKCDSLLVYAAVHSNSHAEEFFGRGEAESKTAEQAAGHQLARGNPSSPYFDHGEWKKLKKMQYESAAVAYYSRPSQEQIAGPSSPLYSGVQVLRAVAAGSTVREVALLLAFGETPLTEEEAAVEALLPPWTSISQLKTEKERDELKEKAKKQLREARRLAHWNAANNHFGNHAEMANKTLIPLSSHLLRLLNILPKNARDRTSRELQQSRYLTDLELERLLRAFRDEVNEQEQAFWAGAEYSITAHIKDPEHALHEWLFFKEDRKDDVAKQYDYMKENVLAFLKRLVDDDDQSIYDERTGAGRNTGRGNAGAEQDQDNSLQRAGSQRLAVLPERPGRGNMLTRRLRLRKKTKTNNLTPSPKGTATERSSALVSELFPGPLEADSGVAIRRTPRPTSKGKGARVEAEFIALLFVLYTKQRDEATATAAQVGPDGFAALVRTILEGQNEYWNDKDDHDKGVHASCPDGRLERLQTSLIGRITPPDARGALTTTSNAADQLLHFLSGLFSKSPALAVAREGDELVTYPALQDHPHLDAFLHPDVERNEERSGKFVPRDLRYLTEMLLVGKRDAHEISRLRDEDFWKMAFENDETYVIEFKKAVAWVRRLVANRLLHAHADLWDQDKLLFSRLATIAAANEEFSTLTRTLAVAPAPNNGDAAVLDVGKETLDRHPKLSDESKRKNKALAAESYLFLIDHQTPSRNEIVKRDENDPGQRDDDGDEDADSGNEDEDHEAGVAEEGEHQLEEQRVEREAAPAPESENAADQETKLAREQGVSTKHDRLQVEQKLRRFLGLVNSIVNMIVSDSARLNDWIDEKTRPEQEQQISM